MTFQLKLIAWLILFFNSFIPKKGQTVFYIFLIALASMGNVIYRFYFDLKIPYEYRAMKTFIEMKQSVMFYFFSPFGHLQPLIVGLLIGHWILNCPGPPNNLRPLKNAITGLFCLALFLTCFIYTENINLFDPQIGQIQVILMITVGRLMLVSFHSWIIYASIKGQISMWKSC